MADALNTRTVEYCLQFDLNDFNANILLLTSDSAFMLPEIGEIVHIEQLPERRYKVIGRRQRIQFQLSGGSDWIRQVEHIIVEKAL